MRITSAILLISALHVSATGIGQTVSYSGKNVPLEQVFTAIKQQTGYVFFYKLPDLEGAKPVTVDFKNVPLEAALQKILQNQSLSFSIQGNTIFITLKTPTTVLQSVDSLPPHPVKTVHAQGVVYNESGQPLSGANIVIKELEKGTITNAKGVFDLGSVQINSTIIISYTGYSPQQIKIKDDADLKIYLKIAKNELDKVVVQAYGTTTQRLATGNIGTVTSEQIDKQPVGNILDALQGQVPGAVVTNTSGYASGTVKVEIRGRNTINPNFPSDPLYIIDGVPLYILPIQGSGSYSNGSPGLDPYLLSPTTGGQSGPAGQSPLYNINPSDVESIEVLKDADATAIYGSRGANGVILITTKKGKAGKAHFDIRLNEGMTKITQHYNLLNTKQYVEMREEALQNDGLPVDINNAPDLVAWDTTRYTDWQKYAWGGIGKATDIQTALSGGDAQTTFRISGGYSRTTNVLTVSGADERGSASLNLNHKSVNQKISISFTSNFTYVSINEISTPANVTIAPNAPAVYDSNGNLNYLGWIPLDNDFQFGGLLATYTAKSNLFNNNLILSYELIKGLSIKASLGYNNFQNHQSSSLPIAAQDPVYSPTGSANVSNITGYTLIEEPQIEYNGFVGKGKLNGLLGASNQETQTEGILVGGQGFNDDALLSNVGNAPIKFETNNSGEYKYAALFGRLNYNWENEYIININARRDGSSRFGPGRQYGNFGSMGAAWIFSEEPLIKNGLPVLSFGKLRASYGTTGGDQINDYSYLTTWSFTGLSYNNNLAISPTGHTDSLLHWQVNRKLELALSLGFLKDRVSLDVSWYQDRCSDQLIPFPTPIFTGFNKVTANWPADVQNSGLEYIANVKVVDNSNFKWAVKFDVGINRNKLIDYPGLAQSPYAAALQIGQSLNAVKLLHYIGVNTQTGLYSFETKNANGLPTISYNGQPDDRHWVDLSAKYDGSFTNKFIYKNWELSLLFYFKKQLGRNFLAYSANTPPGATDFNQPIQVLRRWQKPGDIAPVAKFTTNPDISFNYFGTISDAAFTDASFIRLQNVYLSYALTSKALKKSGISSLHIFLKAENIFVITKYNGLDPEVQNFGALPIPRILTTGLSCNF